MIKKIISIGMFSLVLFGTQVLAGGSFQNSGKCSVQLQMTQNLKAPNVGERYVRNGNYHWYTKKTVTEAHILQQHLNRLGFNAGKVDGVIGPNTKGAILRMQSFLGTKQDGYVGPKTRALLNNSCGNSLSNHELYEDNDLWAENYDEEDVVLSRKAYTDEYAYSNYVSGDFSLDTNIKVTDKNTREYMDIDLLANATSALNIPELEMDFDVDFSYDVDTNQEDILFDFKQMAAELNLDYRDFMRGGLSISAVIKDLDAYVKVSDIPNFYWDSIENEMDSINEVAKRKVSIRDIKKYEDQWIKIETPAEGKEFAEIMIRSLIPKIKEQALSQAKIYRERPFMIIDKSSQSRSGEYYSYDARVDINNLMYVSSRMNEGDGIKISISDGEDIKDLIQQNKDILKDFDFKVYLNKKTDELRKISFKIDLSLDEMEKDIEMEIFLDLEFEVEHLSNTRENDINVPRDFEKWENVFENIFGRTFEDLQKEEMQVIVLQAGDASVKAYVGGLPSQAIIFYDDHNYSYENVCNVLDQKIQNISGFNCNDSETAYAVEAKLPNGYYCVDSMGNRGEISYSLGSQTACE